MDYVKLYKLTKAICTHIEMLIHLDKDSEAFKRLKAELDTDIKSVHEITKGQ